MGGASAKRSDQPRKRDAFAPEELQQLVEQAKSGDVTAFRALYDGYAPKIVNYVYRMTASRDDADDLTQETFVLAFRNLKSLKENSKFQSWLYRIAQNSVYQKHRNRTPPMESVDDRGEGGDMLDLPSPGKTPEGLVLSRELQQVVGRVIGELPEKCREVFILSAIHQHSYEAITEIVGRSLASVKSDIHRARVEVRDRIKKYLGDGYGMPNMPG